MCGEKALNNKILGKRLNTSQGRNPKNKIGITTTICQCKNCGLIYSNPQPRPYDIQDHYGIPPESYWEKEYFNYDHNYFKAEIQKLFSLLGNKQNLKSLDIGAGLGKHMIALTHHGFDAYGIEPSKPFYERAISKMGINPEKLKYGMLENIDFPIDYFDFIFFGAVLEHLYDPSNSINRALKWLKPNGIIYIQVPSSIWLINNISNLYYKMTLSDYVGNISPMHEPFHLFEFSLKSFEMHAKQNNYKIAFHEYLVCQTYMPKLLDKILKPIMKWTNTGMELYVWIKKNDII
jgi:SAM-dependent methyltransferase